MHSGVRVRKGVLGLLMVLMSWGFGKRGKYVVMCGAACTAASSSGW